MKKSYTMGLLIVLLFFSVHGLIAETVTEMTIGGGYQNNLFNDSNTVGDRYGMFAANLKYYPSSSIQIYGAGQHQAYFTNSDHSNTRGEVSILYVPTQESSALSVALGGRMSLRKFGAVFDLYDQASSSLSAEAGYRIGKRTYLRSSISYLNKDYINSDYGSSRNVDLSTGLNLTILGSNSFALRFDFNRRSFDQVSLEQNNMGNPRLESRVETETFNATGLLLRLSRPLGTRTGLGLSAGHRQLHVDHDFTVMGYTIDYLSPWAELWEGGSAAASIKHFFPSQLIAELSLAYFDKEFADVVEYSEEAGDEYRRGERSDQLATLSLNISRPFSLQSGKTIVPSVYFGYRRNESTVEFYDYESFETSLTLRMSI